MISQGLLVRRPEESLIAAILFTLFLVDVSAYGGGAPPRVCESMTPGHGQEQTGASPYNLTILDGETTYSDKTTIRVQLSGGSYSGLMLQARRKGSADTTPLGRFATLPTGTKYLECSVPQDTVTHSSSSSKSSGAIFVWGAPDQDEGDIEFVATIAQRKNTWWQNQRTVSISSGYIDNSVTPTLADIDTTTTASSTTTPTITRTTTFDYSTATLADVTPTYNPDSSTEDSTGHSSRLTYCHVSAFLWILFWLLRVLLR